MKKIVFLLCLALMFWSGRALAGTFAQSDASSLLNLTPGDVAQLQHDAASAPFDVKLLVESVPSVSQLGSDAHQAVTSPNVVVVGIDPVGNHVSVRFGKNIGVKQGDFDSVSKSGNAHFHNREWVAGIETIVLRAQASAQSSTAISQSSEPVYVKQGLSGEVIFLIVVLVCGFAGLAIWLYRRQRADRDKSIEAMNELREEASEYRTRNVEMMTMPDSASDPVPGRRRTVQSAQPAQSRRSAVQPRSRPAPAPLPPSVPWTPPAPAPVIVDRSGNDFATGLLVGEALSQPRVAEREVVVEREERHSRRSRDRDDDDAGGSSSTFDGSDSSFGTSKSDDSGGSDSSYSPSSSSDDSGGSSSSFDMPSFDSGDSGGGGGSDGGGGDSSF